MSHQTNLAFLLHRANQAVAEAYAEAGVSVTLSQLFVLNALKVLGGASQSGLVTATGVDRSTMADIVRRLSVRGLVNRRRNNEDARAYSVRLTASGERELAKAVEALAKTEQRLLQRVPAAVRGPIIAGLVLIAQADDARAVGVSS